MPSPTPPVLEIHSGIMLKGQLSMAKDVVLTGKFEGDLQTLGCLTVAPGGIMIGSIDAGALILEPGNLVEAKIKVGAQPKPAMAKMFEETKKAAGNFWSGRLQKLKDFALGHK